MGGEVSGNVSGGWKGEEENTDRRLKAEREVWWRGGKGEGLVGKNVVRTYEVKESGGRGGGRGCPLKRERGRSLMVGRNRGRGRKVEG